MQNRLKGIKLNVNNKVQISDCYKNCIAAYTFAKQKTELFDMAEPIPSATSLFAAAAKENEVVLVTSVIRKRAPGLYHNTSVVLKRWKCCRHIYRKCISLMIRRIMKKFYFTPGDIGFTPISTSGKLGLLVVGTQWYPEAARLMALSGAKKIIYPTAIGWEVPILTEKKAIYGVANHSTRIMPWQTDCQ